METEQDGITYTLFEKNAFEESFSAEVFRCAPEKEGDIVIPSQVIYDGKIYNVRKISHLAFYGNKNITSIVIPDGVKVIGDNAFEACTELAHIVIPGSVKRVGAGILCGTKWWKEQTDGIVYAGNILCGWNGEAPKDLHITIKEGTTCIATGAFSYSVNYDSEIPEATFAAPIQISSISIPRSVETIGSFAFRGCNIQSKIYIPDSVTYIGTNAFAGCSNTTGIVVASENRIYDSRNNCNAIIKTSTETLVLGCAKTTIPNDISSIDWNAFEDCTNLVSIDIPSNIKEIQQSAFCGCRNLTTVILHSGIQEIEGGVFSGCEKLKHIYLPDSISDIDNCFYGCPLESIVVDSNNPVYDSRGNCNAIIETSSNTLVAGCAKTTIPDSIETIGSYAFDYCTGLVSIDIPFNVRDIQEYAFCNCENLTTVTLHSGIQEIEKGVFSGCEIKHIYIPDSMVYINNCFQGCPLESIIVDNNNPVYDSRGNCNAIIETSSNTIVAGCAKTIIPQSVKTIGYGAFSYSNIQSISIPSNITTIEKEAFYGSALSKITFEEGLRDIDCSAFRDCHDNRTLQFPNSLKYIRGTWSDLGGQDLTTLIIPNDICYIQDSDEEYYPYFPNLTYLQIPRNMLQCALSDIMEKKHKNQESFSQKEFNELLGLKPECKVVIV